MKTLISFKNSMLSLLVTLIIAGTALGATGGDDESQTVEITGTDRMKYSVKAIEATPGQEITIVFTTKSRIPKQAMAHNVVLLDKGTDAQAFVNASAKARDNQYIAPGFADQILAATDLAGGGETVKVTFTAPEEAGDYTFLCSFPGHFAGGMKGVLTVKG